MLKTFALLLALAPFAIAAPFAAEIEAPYVATSKGGLYKAGLTPESEPVAINAMQSWTLTLTGADGVPVEGASVTIDGGMPMHGHGLPSAPQVTESLGDGRYLVEGVKFNMAGEWVINLAIEAPAGADTVTFQLPL